MIPSVASPSITAHRSSPPLAILTPHQGCPIVVGQSPWPGHERDRRRRRVAGGGGGGAGGGGGGDPPPPAPHPPSPGGCWGRSVVGGSAGTRGSLAARSRGRRWASRSV